MKLDCMSDVTTDPLASPAPATAPAEPEPPARPGLTRRQRAIMVLLLVTQFMLAIDFSILNVALRSIGVGLHIGTGQLQWVATAFALPAAGFMLLVVASLVGGFADDTATLLVARAGQGLAAAIAAPSALSLLVLSFPEGPLRERAGAGS
jgi:MFS family permease